MSPTKDADGSCKFAVLAAAAIFRDIEGRKGIGDDLESCEEDIQEEMREKWAKIIHKSFVEAERRKGAS